MRCPALLPAAAVTAGALLGATCPSIADPVSLAAVWMLSVMVALGGLLTGAARAATVAMTGAFLIVGTAAGGHEARRVSQPALWRWYEEQLRPGDRWREPVTLEGTLRGDARPAPYGAMLDLEVARVTCDARVFVMHGTVRVTVGGTLVPGQLGEWRAGRTVRMAATLHRSSRYLNPGVADQEEQAAVRGIALVGSVKSAALVEPAAEGHRWGEIAAEARDLVRRIIDRRVGAFATRSAGIVTAILIGDRAGLDEETTRRLQESGTYHVIAISGGNIAILAGCVLGLVSLAGIGARAGAIVSVGVLAAYAAVVVREASVLRATAAAVLFLTARAVDHRTPPLNALAIAALAIVVVTPLAVFDAGAILTFGATLAILVGVPRVLRWMQDQAAAAIGPAPRWVAAPLALVAATYCIELALLPVSARVFSRVTVAGLMLNLLAVPLMTVTQVSGLLVVALEGIWSPAAMAMAGVAHLAASGLVESSRLLDVAPWLSVRTAPPPLALVCGYYVSLGCVVIRGCSPAIQRLGRVGLLFCILGILAGPLDVRGFGVRVGLWGPLAGAETGRGRPGRLRVVFLDVGQGDATFVRFPDGQSLLVDAGGTLTGSFDIGERVVGPALWAQQVRRLDYLALTHGDPDHAGGALAVLRDFRPREVWEGVPVASSASLQAIAHESRRQHSVWRRLQAGDLLFAGGASLEVWHPPPPDWERPRVRNEDSVVMELRYGDVSVVLPGDIGVETEPTLAARVRPARVRVVKVPHHGSGGSSSAAFVEALRPDVAVVSAGRHNAFGHPAPAVVARYQEAGAVTFDTARHGAVTAETDGRTMTVTTMTGEILTR